MLKAELSRFKVKEGKSGKVDEWMAFLNEHMEDTLFTLENEKMFVESIHREVVNGTEFLYWYSVQGEGGTEVYDSESYIDIMEDQHNIMVGIHNNEIVYVPFVRTQYLRADRNYSNRLRCT